MEDRFDRFDSEIHEATRRARDTAAEQRDAMELGRIVTAHQLDVAWQQFQAASSASGRALEATRSEPDGVPQNVTLTWRASAPPRTLTLRTANVGGHILWELRGDFATLDIYGPDVDLRNGIVPAADLTSDVIHHLIMALLKQDAWGSGQLPEVLVPGSMAV
jgi:hypothetical protein